MMRVWFTCSNKCMNDVLDKREEFHIVNLCVHVEVEGS